MKSVDLYGITKHNKKKTRFAAEITMTTGDGRTTLIESGYIYRDEEEAICALKGKLEEIMMFLADEGYEVAEHQQGPLQ